MAKAKPERPRRTREHIIAAQSINYVEKFFIDKGHTVDRPGEDYGYDLVVNTFDDQGYAESCEIRIQLKASDNHNYIRNRTFLSIKISRSHYELWAGEVLPVFLILYDAREAKAYWLHVQEYFASDLSRKPAPGTKTLTLRIPIANLFTEETVDHMRKVKSQVVARFRERIEYEG